MTTSSTLSILLIAIYLLAVFLLTWRARLSRKSSAEDYFILDRRGTWLPLAITFFATWMSTFAFIGSPGSYHIKGVAWYIPHGLLVVASPILVYFVGTKLARIGRQRNHLTPGDFFGDFFSSEVARFLSGVVSLLALIPYCLIQLIAVGIVTETATAGLISMDAAIIIAAASIIIYGCAGGVRAVVFSDVLQGLLFSAVMLAGVGIVLWHTGNPVESLSRVVETSRGLFFAETNIASTVSTALIWTFGYILLPHMWQRCYMAADEQSLRKSALLGGVLALLVILLPSLYIGFFSHLFMSAENANSFVPSLYSQAAPHLLPLLVVATFAAGMSTIDSQLLSASSVLFKDVLRKNLHPSDEEMWGKVFLAGFILLILAVYFFGFGEGEAITSVASKGVAIAFVFLAPLIFVLRNTDKEIAGGAFSIAIGLAIILLPGTLLFEELPAAPLVAFLAQYALLLIANTKSEARQPL